MEVAVLGVMPLPDIPKVPVADLPPFSEGDGLLVAADGLLIGGCRIGPVLDLGEDPEVFRSLLDCWGVDDLMVAHWSNLSPTTRDLTAVRHETVVATRTALHRSAAQAHQSLALVQARAGGLETAIGTLSREMVKAAGVTQLAARMKDVPPADPTD